MFIEFEKVARCARNIAWVQRATIRKRSDHQAGIAPYGGSSINMTQGVMKLTTNVVTSKPSRAGVVDCSKQRKGGSWRGTSIEAGIGHSMEVTRQDCRRR